MFTEQAGVVGLWSPIIWASSALAGLAIATNFATLVLWIDERVEFGGKLAAVVGVGGSLGATLGAPIVGYLFENVTPMSYAYSLVVTSSALVVVCGILLAYAARFGVRFRREKSTGGTAPART